ncbi:MAG: hypothetical protein K6C11_04045 [Bacilli bacterium]|nr:hypothetical protein [Bacilli bacterium]
MEDYERFKLNKSNIIMLVITSILLIIIIVVSVLLFKAVKKPASGLPTLNITEGRYTTQSTTASTATTSTTTTKAKREASPYYEIKPEEYLTEELFTKQDLNKDEALKVAQQLFELTNKLYDITDNSLFDIDILLQSVKDGEKDMYIEKDTKYGELYNLQPFLDRFFVRQTRNMIFGYKVNNKYVFLREGDKVYRLSNIIGDAPLVIVDSSVQDYTPYNITLKIRYYNSNYKQMGYTAPNYSYVNFYIAYEDGRWKVKQYVSPIYD